jgi:uncharacterized integral membrane protein
MSISVILTLVVAFVVVVFSLFNADVVTINLIGFKTVSLPMSFLVFFVFIFGAIYAAVLSFQIQIEQVLTIRRLKKKIRDIQEAEPVDNQEAVTAVSTAKAAPEVKPAKPVYARVMMPPQKKTREIPVQKEPVELPADPIPDEAPDMVAALADSDDEDEGGLSSKLREIALRRIQNG